MIDTVFLDADGVIQFPGPGFRERFEELLGGRVPVRHLFDTEETTLNGTPDLRDVLAEYIRVHELPATVDELLEAWNNIYVNEAALALVDELRADGIKCFLTTNQQEYRGRHIQRTLGYEKHFDKQFFSFELGESKPTPRFFERVLADTGADPSSTLFVDDLAANVEAARSLGLTAEVYEWTLGMPRPTDATALRSIFRRHGLLA